MDTVEHLIRLFSYDAWANREVLAALRTAGLTPAYTDFILSVRQGFVE